MQPEVWNLLHDGVVVGLVKRATVVRVTVSAPHLAQGFGGDAFDIVLTAAKRVAYCPDSERWDEPWLEEPRDVVRAQPELVEARSSQGELRVRCVRGVLALDYADLSLEVGGRSVPIASLRDAVAAYWASWRKQCDASAWHPLAREALRGAWSAALLPRLLAAWRLERTSELAEVTMVLGHALDREPRPLATLDAFAGWRAHYERSPSVALEALAEAATSTFDLLSDEDPGIASPRLGPWLDARRALGARWWRALADAVGALRSEPPDPRIGRAVIAMLRSPSDHWFRSDQVAHVAGPFAAPDGLPSFADHAFALLETHGDGGTPARLEACAREVGIECDCNGAEMRDRLREIAATLHARYPTDRSLTDTARSALVHRPLDAR